MGRRPTPRAQSIRDRLLLFLTVAPQSVNQIVEELGNTDLVVVPAHVPPYRVKVVHRPFDRATVYVQLRALERVGLAVRLRLDGGGETAWMRSRPLIDMTVFEVAIGDGELA